MRTRAQLKHDGGKAQMGNRVPRSFAFVDNFLQRRTDEDAQALIRCTYHASTGIAHIPLSGLKVMR